MAPRNSRNQANSEPEVNSEETSPQRTEPVDVTPGDAESRFSRAFAAAYDILHHLLGVNYESWEATPEGMFFHGVTMDASHGVTIEQVVSDIAEKVRRAQLYPTILWLSGITPAAPEPSTVQASITQFWRGAGKSGDTKTPEYIRKAAIAYRQSTGSYEKRGPKPKSISFKDIASGNVTPEVLLKGMDNVEDLQTLLATAQAAIDARLAQNGNSESTTPAVSATESPDSTAEAVGASA